MFIFYIDLFEFDVGLIFATLIFSGKLLGILIKIFMRVGKKFLNILFLRCVVEKSNWISLMEKLPA